jgi:hypothetical protein
MIYRKEITFRFLGRGATWGLWARVDASRHTDSDAHITTDDRLVVSQLAWLRHSKSLAPSIVDKFAEAIEKGRTSAWDLETPAIWLVEVHQYTSPPTDSDENTPTLAIFAWLSEVLGPGAVEPTVQYERTANAYRVDWRPRDPASKWPHIWIGQ